MFIKENRKQYPIGIMCKELQVSRTGYHYWLRKRVSCRKREDEKLLEEIKFHYKKSKGRYGLPRITEAIRKEGIKVNKKRIWRLMKTNNIKAKTRKPFKITTKQNRLSESSLNLLRGNFSSANQNKIWTSDITYLWTKEGWLYLAVVMDIYSRKIVGWSVQSSLSTDLLTRH